MRVGKHLGPLRQLGSATRGPLILCALALGASSCSKHNEEPASGENGTLVPPGTFPGAGAGGLTIGGGSGQSAIGVGTAGFGAPGFPAAGGGAAGFGAAGAAGNGIVTAPGAASVLQYHAHANRDGLYVDPAFTRVAAGTIKRDPMFVAAIKGPTYAQPLYVDSADGNDLIITATEQNEVSAISAVTGLPKWQVTLGPPGEPGCGGSIRPLGITGTPVIDMTTRTLYLASMQADRHWIYALSLDDGSLVQGGWPIDVNTVVAGAVTFNSKVQNQRGALLIVNNMLYVPYGGNFQDCGDFHGWVVGVPLDNPKAPIAFATKGLGGGIWAPGGLVSDGTSIFAATGNTMEKAGAMNTSPAMWSQGNAVLRLTPDLKDVTEGQTVDFFATKSWKDDDKQGWDLGSSAPVLFGMPGAGAESPKMLLAMGKNGSAYLLDSAKLGGIGGELASLEVTESGSLAGGMIQAHAMYPTPTGMFAAFRSSQVPMACAGGMMPGAMPSTVPGTGNFAALKVTAGTPPKLSLAWCAEGNGTGSPIVTSPDGMTDSVVWFFAGGKLNAVNGETGVTLFRESMSVGTVDKYQTPIVAKGRLFVAASDAVYAYTLK